MHIYEWGHIELKSGLERSSRTFCLYGGPLRPVVIYLIRSVKRKWDLQCRFCTVVHVFTEDSSVHFLHLEGPQLTNKSP